MCYIHVDVNYRVVHDKRPIFLSISCLIQLRYSRKLFTKLFHNDIHFIPANSAEIENLSGSKFLITDYVIYPRPSLLNYGGYTHVEIGNDVCNHISRIVPNLSSYVGLQSLKIGIYLWTTLYSAFPLEIPTYTMNADV